MSSFGPYSQTFSHLPLLFPTILLPVFLHSLKVGGRWPLVFSHVGKVVFSDEGEVLLLLEDEVVAGDEVETPAAELLGIVEL